MAIKILCAGTETITKDLRRTNKYQHKEVKWYLIHTKVVPFNGEEEESE